MPLLAGAMPELAGVMPLLGPDRRDRRSQAALRHADANRMISAMAPEGSEPGRRVTLVLVDRDGSVIGALGPFDVPLPWWQELGPIHARVPGIVVLRMLAAERAAGHPMGGDVTYLAEVVGEVPPGVLPWEGELEDHPLRMPWARPGGPAADLAWADSIVEPTGPPVQHRAWNLSSIWSIPTGDTSVWLKCVPPFFAHEAAVIGFLAGRPVPRLLAAAGHRILLGPLPGRDGYAASPPDFEEGVRVLVALQAATADRVGELIDLGVPDRRFPQLVAAAHDVVERNLPDDRSLRRLLDGVAARVAAIDECGLPDVLVHGDAHPGNLRVGGVPPVWFDWGDAIIGHPLLEPAVLSGRPGPIAGVRETWLDLWEAASPGSDPRRAWRLLRPLAHLRTAALFQQFLDGIEPSERPFHDKDVLPALMRAGAAYGADACE